MNIKPASNNIKYTIGAFLFLLLFLPQVTQAGDWCFLQERASQYEVFTFSIKSQEYIDGYKYSHDLIGDLTCNTLIPKVSLLDEQEKAFLQKYIQKSDLQDGVYKMSYDEYETGKYRVGERELISSDISTYATERTESVSMAREVWRDTTFNFLIGIFSYTTVLWFMLFVFIFKIKSLWFRLLGLIVTMGWSIFMIIIYTIGEHYYWRVSDYISDISRLLLWGKVEFVCVILMVLSIFIGIANTRSLYKDCKHRVLKT